MAQTGMETVEILRELLPKPSRSGHCRIACRAHQRLNRTHPHHRYRHHSGSGGWQLLQCHYRGASGHPRDAIGIPTVVDAATIIADFCMGPMEENKSEPEEMEASVRSLISPKLNTAVCDIQRRRGGQPPEFYDIGRTQHDFVPRV